MGAAAGAQRHARVCLNCAARASSSVKSTTLIVALPRNARAKSLVTVIWLTGALVGVGATVGPAPGIGVLAAGNLMNASAGIGQQLQKQIGQTGIPVYNVANACATGATALRTVIMAIKSGECDYGLAVGVEVFQIQMRVGVDPV